MNIRPRGKDDYTIFPGNGSPPNTNNKSGLGSPGIVVLLPPGTICKDFIVRKSHGIPNKS